MESSYITFSEKASAEKAVEYMDQAQLDGLDIKVRFTLKPTRQNSPRRNYGRGGGMGGGKKTWRRSPPRNIKQDSPSRKRNLSRSSSKSPKRVKVDG